MSLLLHFPFDGSLENHGSLYTSPYSLDNRIEFSTYNGMTGLANTQNSKTFVSKNVSMTNNYTISCWVYVDSTNIKWSEIFTFKESISSSSKKMRLVISTSGAITLFINDETSASGNSLPTNQWTHYALVFDSTNTTKIYIDGVLKSTLSVDRSVSIDSKDMYSLFCSNASTTTSSPIIRDFRLYNTALSTSELEEVRNAPFVKFRLSTSGKSMKHFSEADNSGNNKCQLLYETNNPDAFSYIIFSSARYRDYLYCDSSIGSWFNTLTNDIIPKEMTCKTLSVSFWFKYPTQTWDTTTNQGGFFSILNDTNAAALNPNNCLSCSLSNSTSLTITSGTKMFSYTVPNITDNVWHQMTIVVNDKTITVYIDNNKYESSTSLSTNITLPQKSRLYLKTGLTHNNKQSYAYNCSLSDFRLYYTALPESMIEKLYKQTAEFSKCGSVNCYEIEESTPMHLRIEKSGKLLIDTFNEVSGRQSFKVSKLNSGASILTSEIIEK